MTTVIVAVVVGIIALFLGRMLASSHPQPEPKRFGLAEAEAALAYVGNAGPGAVRAVLGVVVGVLQFENAVADDAAQEVADLSADSDRWKMKVTDNQVTIDALRAKIVCLEAAMVSNDKRAEAVRKVAEAFSA